MKKLLLIWIRKASLKKRADGAFFVWGFWEIQEMMCGVQEITWGVQEINSGVHEITLLVQEISSTVPEIVSFELYSS